MPTYEYRCGTCTHQFEVFARMSDPDPEVCEACGEPTLEKVLFPVAVHYKGSGFYNTDYGNKRSGGAGESKSSDATPVAGTDTSGSSSEGSSSSASSGDSGTSGGSTGNSSTSD
jgi:putative FmdB family regulatory protein